MSPEESSGHAGPGASEADGRAASDSVAARLAIRDTTRLTRLLTILGEPLPIMMLLDNALATLSELFASDIVVLLDPGGTGEFSPLAAVGLPEDTLLREFSNTEVGLLARTMRSGAPVLCADAWTDPAVDGQLRELGAECVVSLPVGCGNSSRGALVLARCHATPFTHDDVGLLHSMAYRIGLALEQAQWRVQMERLVEAGQRIGRHLAVADVTREAVRLFPPVVGAHAAVLALIDDDGRVGALQREGLGESHDPIWVHLASRYRTESEGSGRLLETVDLAADLDPQAVGMAGPCRVRSLLAVPLAVQGRLQGLLFAIRFSRAAFLPDSPQIAMLFASQISSALENARLYQLSRDELSRRGQLETELRAAKDAAETASNAKTMFLANMSHELRTPLNSIIGFSEIMKEQVFGPVDNPKYRQYVDDIWTAGRGLLNLINDILDISRVEAGELAMIDEWFDPADLIRDAVRDLAGRARAGQLELRTEIRGFLPRLYADPLRVRQIVVNLLTNAVKFTPENGTVTVLGSVDPSGRLVIAVADTGIGIPEDKLGLVMSVFGRVDDPLVKACEGAGLGLPLGRKLAEMHGAKLELSSRVGSGTTARIVFPLHRIEPSPGTAGS